MNPPATAPKDETFLGCFGWPWLCMTRWNGAIEKWSYANYQVGMYEGECNDVYFETENEPEAALKGWLPLPESHHPCT